MMKGKIYKHRGGWVAFCKCGKVRSYNTTWADAYQDLKYLLEDHNDYHNDIWGAVR